MEVIAELRMLHVPPPECWARSLMGLKWRKYFESLQGSRRSIVFFFFNLSPHFSVQKVIPRNIDNVCLFLRLAIYLVEYQSCRHVSYTQQQRCTSELKVYCVTFSFSCVNFKVLFFFSFRCLPAPLDSSSKRFAKYRNFDEKNCTSKAAQWPSVFAACCFWERIESLCDSMAFRQPCQHYVVKTHIHMWRALHDHEYVYHMSWAPQVRAKKLSGLRSLPKNIHVLPKIAQKLRVSRITQKCFNIRPDRVQSTNAVYIYPEIKS